MSQTFNNFRAGLPPPAECLAILIGCAELTIFGLGGLANPWEFAKGYGLPLRVTKTLPGGVQTTEEEKVEQTQKALVAAIAARNIQNGIVLLTFACYWRDRRALGTCIAAGLVTTMADLLLVQWYGVKEAVFGHVIGVANSTLIGGALLYWTRDSPLW